MAFNANIGFVGLQTQLIGIPTTGVYNLSAKLTLPEIPEGSSAASQVVITITQTPSGGSPSTIYTGMMSARGFSIPVYGNALDVLSVSLSSSATVDQGLQSVKCVLSIG